MHNVTDYSYHGHPDPLDCPPGITRKSVALYYYTNGRPDDGGLAREPQPLLYDAARWLYPRLKRRR